MSIKIIIDSSSDISVEEAQKLGVEMLPMQVAFNQKVFYDGVDLLPNDFYKKLEEENVLPKTSQITQYRFEEKISELVDQGHEVIVITISSKLSNTYNNAVLACNEFKDSAYAVDSLNAVSGEKVLCLYALKLIEEGLSVKEIIDKLNEVKHNIVVLAGIDTLEYLKKGGRISSTAAAAGEMLSIKPIISVVNGEIKMVNKAIGQRRAFKMLDQIIATKEINEELPYSFIYSGVDNSNLLKYLSVSAYKDKLDTSIITQIGSTVGTHIGSGAVGLVYFKK